MRGLEILREVSFFLPMEPEMEIAASQEATAFAAAMGMSADRIDEIRMAVVEACINAMEHSRASDQLVHLRLAALGKQHPERLEITIRDQGVGFRPESIEDPSMDSKIHDPRKRGWGLKIIRGLMDDVAITSDARGTTLVMVKAR